MSKRVPVTQQFANNQKLSRRTILKMGLGISIVPITGASCSNSSQSTKQTWTPRQTEGPFYPVHEQEDKDADLTLIQGNEEPALGEIIHVRGRVLDMNGDAIKNAFIEIWQANAKGRYRHYKDPNKAAIDPNFQGWGEIYTDADGMYRFKTIMPGAYPAGPGWTRPPHIHFKVTKQQYYPLITQMYFPGLDLNKTDRILQNLSEADQDMVISRRQLTDDEEPVFIFDIVLRRAT
ncbi:MAG: protocatechuate 3,4-dioxygenase [Gammaproteobacteria bacterium]